MLLFKPEFQDAIRAGRKTQTVRLWRRPMVRPGQITRITGGAVVRILTVEEVRFEDLTETDALADGFTDLTALRTAVAAIYALPSTLNPLPSDVRQWYRVRFEYRGEVEDDAQLV